MKLRWKILIAAGVLAVLLAANMMVMMRTQPQDEVEAYKKSLRDQGENLEISEVLPPPVPDESNGAALLESAFGLLGPRYEGEISNTPPAMRMVAPGKAMVGWAQPDLRGLVDLAGRTPYTNSWENALAANEARKPVIELLRQAASLPALDFKPDCQESFEPSLPHLAPLGHASSILMASILCDIHTANEASAMTNICTLLQLAQKEGREPVITSQRMRLRMADMASAATWELLQSTNVTDQGLAQLQREWQQQEYLNGAENAFLLDRAWKERLILTSRASASEFNRLFQKAMPDPDVNYATLAVVLRPWSAADEERMLKKEQIILNALRSARANHPFALVFNTMDSRLAAMALTNAPGPLTVKLGLSDLATGMGNVEWLFSETLFDRTPARSFADFQAARQVVVAAISLRRFQLRHGELPDSLADLVPEFLSAPPLDLMDGKPLRYRRNGDGAFVLYSVGDDGVDNGGDSAAAGFRPSGIPNWSWRRARDWVWPQPATPAEVEYFYEHPPK